MANVNPSASTVSLAASLYAKNELAGESGYSRSSGAKSKREHKDDFKRLASTHPTRATYIAQAEAKKNEPGFLQKMMSKLIK